MVKICGAGIALAALVLPFASADAASGVPFTNSAVDKIYGAGSDTTYPLMNDLATAYMESDGCVLTAVAFPLTATSPQQNACVSGAGPAGTGDNVFENYDHDVVVNFFPQGSGQGRGQLCNQKAAKDPRVPYLDFARSSAAPGASFQCTVAAGGTSGTVLRFIAFARDAISYTHWSTGTGGGGAVNNLTIAQLRDIFITCAINDWGQVGGVAGKPIVVFTAQAGSGTRSTFEGFIGGGDSSACIPAQFKDGSLANGERVEREHEMEPIETALNDPGAADEGNSISYMSVGLHNSDPGKAGSSLIGSINGIVPTETTIVDGSFPMGRNLYNVIRNSGPTPVASGTLRRFLGMLTSTATNGQQIGWICKAEANHSEQIGNPSPVGNEQATATKDWYEVKKAAFTDNGMFQLAADGFGNRCTFQDVTVP